MRSKSVRCGVALAALVLAAAGLPRSVLGQEPGAPAAEEHASGAHGQEEEHASGHGHQSNEIALFVGGTRRLKFEEDETGLTLGLEYQRRIGDRAALILLFEGAGGDIERDWIGLVEVGYRPFDGWAKMIFLALGTGLEVARIDEAALEADAHGDTGAHAELGAEPEEGAHEERESEVEPVVRLGAGYTIHVGSFSLIPQVSFDVVADDVAVVAGVALGFRF